jgi:hypothetical protein
MAETVESFRSYMQVVGRILKTTAKGGRFPGEEELSATLALKNGTGNNQINKVWGDRRTIAAGANDDLDMSGGLTDGFEVAFNFTVVKGIYIQNISVLDASKIIVGNTGTTLFTAPFVATIGRNNKFMWEDTWSGEAVVATSGDLFRITNANGAGQAIYEIIIIGLRP